MEKIPGFAASLVQINGVAGVTADANKSAFSMAKDITEKLFVAGKSAVTKGLPYVARKTNSAASMFAESTGLSDKWIEGIMPFKIKY